MKRELARAARLYEDFREERPRRARTITLDFPHVAVIMGRCEAIFYSTTHAGKVTRYKHTFAVGSRPFLVAGTKRNQLLLVGGRFHVTARGIVDLSTTGREIEHTRRKRTRI